MKPSYHMKPFCKNFLEYIDVILFFLGYMISLFSGLLMGTFIIFYDILLIWSITSLLFGSLLSVTGIIIFIFYKKD
jgi:hypothetical protein